jgi:hypothetical protein
MISQLSIVKSCVCLQTVGAAHTRKLLKKFNQNFMICILGLTLLLLKTDVGGLPPNPAVPLFRSLHSG